jgi:hypothetical protein
MQTGLASVEIEAADRMYLAAVRDTMVVLKRDEKVSCETQLLGKRNCYLAGGVAPVQFSWRSRTHSRQ